MTALLIALRLLTSAVCAENTVIRAVAASRANAPILPVLPVRGVLRTPGEAPDAFCRSPEFLAQLRRRVFWDVATNEEAIGVRLRCREIGRHVFVEIEADGRVVDTAKLTKPEGSRAELWALLLASNLRSRHSVVQASYDVAASWVEKYLGVGASLDMIHGAAFYFGGEARAYENLAFAYHNAGMRRQEFWALEARRRLFEKDRPIPAAESMRAWAAEAALAEPEGSPQERKIAEYPSVAREAMNNNQYGEALGALQNYLLYAPWSAQGYAELARVYEALGWKPFARAAREQSQRLARLQREIGR